MLNLLSHVDVHNGYTFNMKEKTRQFKDSVPVSIQIWDSGGGGVIKDQRPKKPKEGKHRHKIANVHVRKCLFIRLFQVGNIY